MGRAILPRKPSTINAAQSDMRTHLKPYWGDWAIGAIHKHDVEDWVASMKLAPRTLETNH